MNPIQNIFMENMKKIFNSYNGFYEKIETEHRKKTNEIKDSINDDKTNLETKKFLNKKLQELQNNHMRLIQDIGESLDSFMKTLPESPLSLPIKTKIYIERKNFTIENLLFNPTDSVDKLLEIVKSYFLNKGDEISDVCDAQFYIIRKEFEMHEDSNLLEIQKETKIEYNTKFLSYKINQGDIITFKGNYLLKSEVPKNCITYQFEKVINTTVKYFSCDNCSLNCNFLINIFNLGLCESCIQNCHRNHVVKIHRENHIATWACCYCYRNNCKIKNNKN